MGKTGLAVIFLFALTLSGMFILSLRAREQRARAQAWQTVQVGMSVEEVSALLRQPYFLNQAAPGGPGSREVTAVYPDGSIVFRREQDGKLHVLRIEKK